jgi:hypothetical protein
MKRLNITSPGFTGTAEIWYNYDGLLCYINLNDCVMNFTQIKYLLANISVDYETATALAAGTKLEMTESDFAITLEDFKREYPYSRNYHLLENRWAKLNKKEQLTAYFSAIQYRQYLARTTWQNPMIADTWLARKQYLNDWRKL